MKKLIPVFLFCLLAVPLIASAAGSATGTVCNIMQVAKDIIAIIGFGVAIILLIVSGIRYMTAGGDAEKAKSARGGIINAVIGIIIVVAALFIIGLAQGFVTDVGGINLLVNPCPILNI